ncbi:MAG: hypothetical protein ACK5FG_10405, partial [Chryseotalea sp.]
FSAANNSYLSWLLFWQMKLESINLEKQTANGLSTSRTKATPNSLDRCGQYIGTDRNTLFKNEI